MMWSPLSAKGQGALDHGSGKLMGQNFMVGQIFEEFIKEEGKISTMDARRHSKPSHPNW